MEAMSLEKVDKFEREFEEHLKGRDIIQHYGRVWDYKGKECGGCVASHLARFYADSGKYTFESTGRKVYSHRFAAFCFEEVERNPELREDIDEYVMSLGLSDAEDNVIYPGFFAELFPEKPDSEKESDAQHIKLYQYRAGHGILSKEFGVEDPPFSNVFYQALRSTTGVQHPWHTEAWTCANHAKAIGDALRIARMFQIQYENTWFGGFPHYQLEDFANRFWGQYRNGDVKVEGIHNG